MPEENFAKSNFDSMDKTAPVKPSRSNTFLVILLIILAFSFLLLGFVLGSEYFSKNQNKVVVPSAKSVKLPINEATSGADIANWKMYVNASENFQIQYPNDWQPPRVSGTMMKGQVTFQGKEGLIEITMGTGFGGGPCPNEIRVVQTEMGKIGFCLLGQVDGKDTMAIANDGPTPANFPSISIKVETNAPASQNVKLINSILSTLKFIKVGATDERAVVSNEELKGIINPENKCGADLKLNQEVPNEWIDFSRNGISFKIPYNKNWGNDKYRIDVFDNYIGRFDASDDIFFGNIVLSSPCGIKRDYWLNFTVPMAKANFLQFVNKSAIDMCDLKEMTVNGFELVQYSEFCKLQPEFHTVFIGTKNNYDFRSKNDMTEIIKTVKIIAQSQDLPEVSVPITGAKIVSPLTVKGKVSAGWMFEGQFPIKLTDANKKVIIAGTAKETSPGSWQKNDPVEFSATLNFSTTEKSGFLILENDNPSGDPAKSKIYEVPVNF
jgi:hypothetical protein